MQQTDTVERITGVAPIPLAEFVRENLAKFQGQESVSIGAPDLLKCSKKDDPFVTAISARQTASFGINLLAMRILASLLLFSVFPVFVSAQEAAKKTARRPHPSLVKVEDLAGLPRVLLIGDSISMGYTVPVRELLKGKVNVHRIPANGGPTSRGIASIDKWLGVGKWDVIHFNWGIHDLKVMPDGKRQVEPADYESNLRKLIGKLKATGAKLIWASTTPIPKTKLNPDRKFGDEAEYNAIAAQMMKELKIPVNDLHGYIQPRFSELQRPNDLHYQPEGSDYLAKQVATEIKKALTIE